MKPKYKRVLLKLSGESLAGEMKHGIDFETVLKICKPIKECVDAGVEVGIVVGGGNFWRGRSSGEMDRTRADHMGMLATVINSLALQDALEKNGIPTRVQSAITMNEVAEPFILTCDSMLPCVNCLLRVIESVKRKENGVSKMFLLGCLTRLCLAPMYLQVQ